MNQVKVTYVLAVSMVGTRGERGVSVSYCDITTFPELSDIEQ